MMHILQGHFRYKGKLHLSQFPFSVIDFAEHSSYRGLCTWIKDVRHNLILFKLEFPEAFIPRSFPVWNAEAPHSSNWNICDQKITGYTKWVKLWLYFLFCCRLVLSSWRKFYLKTRKTASKLKKKKWTSHGHSLWLVDSRSSRPHGHLVND